MWNGGVMGFDIVGNWGVRSIEGRICVVCEVEDSK